MTTAHADLTTAARLSLSPSWEDRVRAHEIVDQTRVTLPDQFPCIYETEDSPSRRGIKGRVFDWVVSPDIDMLHELLPDYQELWDAYTSQWGPGSRRVMTVGLLDGLSPASLLVPGTTPAQVIGKTMQTHGGEMYRRAPERLKAMHPQHEAWQAARRSA